MYRFRAVEDLFNDRLIEYLM